MKGGIDRWMDGWIAIVGDGASALQVLVIFGIDFVHHGDLSKF